MLNGSAERNTPNRLATSQTSRAVDLPTDGVRWCFDTATVRHRAFDCLCELYPLDVYPIRSPLIVADFLLPYVRNRIFVEIGTPDGATSLRACAPRKARDCRREV